MQEFGRLGFFEMLTCAGNIGTVPVNKMWICDGEKGVNMCNSDCVKIY